jgi:co-chaperonin GroES (HSP10)
MKFDVLLDDYDDQEVELEDEEMYMMRKNSLLA